MREPFFLRVVVKTACTKLSGKIFAVRHSPYPLSKFELGRPSECGENGWEHAFFMTNKIMNTKKDNENFRPLNSVQVSCAL